MAKFRKKPVVIEAEQWFPGRLIEGVVNHPEEDFAEVATLEGQMRCSSGDWIITGVKGEKYPCKDEIFRMTYDPVEEG